MHSWAITEINNVQEEATEGTRTKSQKKDLAKSEKHFLRDLQPNNK